MIRRGRTPRGDLAPAPVRRWAPPDIFRKLLLQAESHWYLARESILHLMWESDTWLERYVKNAPPRELKEKEMGSES